MVSQLYKKLQELKVNVRLTDGNLDLEAPKGVLSNDLLDEIKYHKRDLIEFINIYRAQKDQYRPIPAAPAAAGYPLSPSQRRLWVVCQLEEASRAYNIPVTYVLQGELDREALHSALQALTRRHESLRTAFRQDEDGHVMQYILPSGEVEPPLRYEDVRGHGQKQEEIIAGLLEEERGRTFDLASGCLTHACLLQVDDSKWIFSYTLHHMICDAWSVRVLMRDVMALYIQYAGRTGNVIPPLRTQYRDYVMWQQVRFNEEMQSRHKNYWLRQFEGRLPVLDFPSAAPRPAIRTYRGGLVQTEVGTALCTALQELCRAQGCTLFMGLMAAVNGLMYRYTGAVDVIIGTPVAGRQHPDLEEQIGFYANTLALRTRFDAADTFYSLLKNVHGVTTAAWDHQDYPLDDLAEALRLQRDMSRNVLFDVVVVLQNISGEAAMPLQHPALTFYEYAGAEGRTSKFDMVLTFAEAGGRLTLDIEYNSDIYAKNDMERFAGHFIQFLAKAVEDPGVSVGRIEYLLPDQQRQMITMLDNTAVDYPRQSTITEIFGQQVEKTPGNIAVTCEGREMTYQALNEWANRLAHTLQQRHGIGRGDLVAVKLERSEWMIVALLGILKSGGAYVPIDPAYPQDRIDYIREDSRCRVMLDGQILEILRQEADQWPAGSPTHICAPDDLAYVIYTSGTTGKPKGALIGHRQVVRLLKTGHPLFDFDDQDVWTFFHSYCFDFSVWEMYGALFNGARLVIVPSMTAKDPRAFIDVLVSEGVTVLNQTPSSFYNIIKEVIAAGERRLRLRYVIFGGEALHPGKLAAWHRLYPVTRLVNMYGITETTVHVTYKDIGQKEIGADSSNIGRPIPTLLCYVLDTYGQIVPPGVWGELYVGGEGVGNGYLNRPELTSQRFVPDPFGKGGRLYRSGDRVRVTPEGALEYGGRLDDQVKVRGHRIELGEISAALRQIHEVRDAVVIARENDEGDNELLAYIITDAAPDIQSIRKSLSQHLPAYMLPAYFIGLDRLPLTSNGKLDKKALPGPAPNGSVQRDQPVAARNEIEQALISVFEEVLKVSPVGVKDDFFMMGGDSIKSIQVVSRLRRRGYFTTIRDVLFCPVVEDLAAKVRLAGRDIDQGLVEGEIPLGPVQARFFQQDDQSLHHFNQSVMLKWQGRLDEAILRQALEKLVLHHDTLRMVYRRTDGNWKQINLGREQSFGLEILTCNNETEFRHHCDRIQASISLEKGPLFKAGLFHHKDGNDRLLLVIHHLVVDGVSWRILLEDLAALCSKDAAAGLPVELPPKTDSFRYWQQRLMEYAGSGELKQEDPYWSEVANTTVARLPVDHPDGRNTMEDLSGCTLTLDATTTRRLMTECYKIFNSGINEMLLAAFSLAVKEVFGSKRLMIEMEGHGREQLGDETDVSRTVGWFTSLFPVVLETALEEEITGLLPKVKEQLKNIPHKGFGYGILRYTAAREYHLKPEISFNFLGEFSADEKEGGSVLFSHSGEYQGRRMPAKRQREWLLETGGMVADSRLRLSIEYSCRQYEPSTIRRLAESWRRHLEALTDHVSAAGQVRQDPVEDIYPLTPLQEGLYFHWASDPDSPAFFEQMSYRLKGRLNITAVEKSYAALISRHAVLRTRFLPDASGKLQQIVHREVNPSFTFISTPSATADEVEKYIQEFRTADRIMKFNLSQGSQMRLAVIQLDEEIYEFIWSHHHILMDGWCVGVLIREFFHMYNAFANGRPPVLDPIIPYSSYISWLGRIDRISTLNWWRQYLSGCQTPTPVLSSGPTPASAEARSVSSEFTIGGRRRNDIRTLCANLGITENTFIQTLWGVLLGKYHGTEDAVFGAVVSGRPAELEGVEQMIGLFVNTVPVRVRWEPGVTVAGLLRQMQQQAAESTKYHYIQLVDIQAATELGPNLFDHILIFENYPVQEMVQQGVEGKGVEEELTLLSSSVEEQTNYNFAMIVIPGETFTIRWTYQSHLCDEDLIRQLQSDLIHLIDQVLKDPEQDIGLLRKTTDSHTSGNQTNMKFSLFYFGSYSGQAEENKYDLLFETARFADEQGFSAVWTPERHFNEFGGLYPNPSLISAALAVTTSRVQIRSGSLVAPLHHPVRIAEDWALVDNLSKGRAGISFASGWQCDDFIFFPENYSRRHEHMLSQIETVRTLWKGGNVPFTNGLGKTTSVRIFPTPVQDELPVWITVSGKTETFTDAGRVGANILTHLLWQDSGELVDKIAAYRKSLKDNGFDPYSRTVSVMVHTFLGLDDDTVKSIVRQPLKDYIRSSTQLIQSMIKSNGEENQSKDIGGRYGSINGDIPPHYLDELAEIAFSRFYNEAGLLGTLDKAKDMIRRLRKFDIDEVACLIDFGPGKKDVMESLRYLDELRVHFDKVEMPAAVDNHFNAAISDEF